MSQSSLLLATKKFLIDNIKLGNKAITESICNVMPDGRPPPGFGELFISIHPGGFRGTSYEILYAVHSINITITQKIDGSPQDITGLQNVVLKYRGIEEIAQKLIEVLIMNYELLSIADSLIEGEVNKWVEPLRFNNASAPRIVGSEWLRSERARESAIIQTITLGDAVRIQFGIYQPTVTEHPMELYNMENNYGSVLANPPHVPAFGD